MIFEANYFDGNSSTTHTVTIHIDESNWIIIFTKKNISKEIIWKINDIKKSKVFTKGLISFSYGNNFPFQKIESTDINFISYISKSDHKNLNHKLDTFLHKSVGRSIALLLLAIISFTAGMYFYIIPTVAINFAEKLPKKYVMEFGDYAFKTLLPDLDINSQQSEKLQSFVDALQLNTKFYIKAYVSKSQQVNAFALSGGRIIIYTALLKKIENEYQLAALIGHEISHIERRHILKNISRDLSGTLFMSILLGDTNNVTTIISENAHVYSQLSYNRNLEKEADIFGIETMKKNNLDVHGMPQLFKLLNAENTVNSLSFLNSHPMLDERIEYSTKIANQQTSFKDNNTVNKRWNTLKNSLYLN